jgi:tRNA1(Val) A37 N6-methylase TrmN6
MTTTRKALPGADAARVEVSRLLDGAQRSALGQYMTPASVARFMASLLELETEDLRVLDPGAGVGSLTAALVEEACSRSRRPRSITATAFELDHALVPHLRSTFRSCGRDAGKCGVQFAGRVVTEDFVTAATSALDQGLFRQHTAQTYNVAILNPPYRKIHSASRERTLLRAAGIETTNLYTAFVGLALRLLEPGGELVAITPRSFCNGPYFRPFRRLLLGEASLRRVHVFESRDRAFADDAVLQENVIFHARKDPKRRRVVLSTSAGPDAPVSSREVSHDAVVDPADPEAFIHLAVSEDDAGVSRRMRALPSRLDDLGLEVSTGRADETVASIERLDDEDFRQEFVALGVARDVGLFHRNRERLEDRGPNSLVVRQGDASGSPPPGQGVRVELSEDGWLVIDVNVTGTDESSRRDWTAGFGGSPVDVETVRDRGATALRFARRVFESLDPHGRHAGLFCNASLGSLNDRPLVFRKDREKHRGQIAGFFGRGAAEPPTSFDRPEPVSRADARWPDALADKIAKRLERRLNT